jgi:arylsulfatase A-like enzyme
MVNDGRAAGTLQRPTSLVDIAPTLIGYLGLPLSGFDGAPVGA